MKTSDDDEARKQADMARMIGTCGTTKALALLQSMGVILSLGEIAAARESGELRGERIAISDGRSFWRYRHEDLQALAERRLGLFPEQPQYAEQNNETDWRHEWSKPAEPVIENRRSSRQKADRR